MANARDEKKTLGSTAQLDWEDHHGRKIVMPARPVRRGRLFLVGEWGWVEIQGPIEEKP